MLGYLVLGEVISREEMEQFEVYKADLFQDEINKTIELMKMIKTIDELRRLYVSLRSELRTNQEIINAKDELKTKSTEKKPAKKTVKIEVEEKKNENN